MNAETFCEHFATFADAPNGVSRLRQMIMQLAIQGRLVPQDAKDKPAESLIADIVKFKAAATGRETQIGELDATAAGFPLPSGWAAVAFGDIMLNRDGERIPVSRDIRVGRKGPYDYYGASGVIDSIDDFLFDKSLLLIGEDGANLINRSTPIAFIAHGKYWVNNHAHVLDGITLEFLRYIELYINAIDLKPYVTGTAQPKMNQAKMNSIVVALPPLAEQRRIVEKVDQLLGLCDELALRQAAQREKRQRLVGATLDRLVSTRNPAEFPTHAHRLRNHFDQLFDTPTTIPQLRQTIFQLAVQGQLVAHDPNDEPFGSDGSVTAAVLSRIDLPSLPRTWWYWRLKHLSERVSVGHVGPTSNHYCDASSGIPFLRSQNVRRGRLDLTGLQYVTPAFHESLRKSRLKAGDLLFVRVGANRGDCCIVPESIGELNCANIVLARPKVPISDYLQLYCQSHVARRMLIGMTTGSAQGVINTKSVAELLVPIPPVAEQKRIVTKVTELLSLCDALEAKLTQAESASTQLISAAVHHLLQKP